MEQAGLYRLAVFTGILVVMMLWEAALPYRPAAAMRRPLRWLTNFGLLVVGAAVTRLVVGAAMIGTALITQREGWGILNLGGVGGFPAWPAGIFAVLALDCAVYWQHRLTHMVPFLWWFHRVHHSDTEFDVTTAIRFHPLEILASALYKSAIVAMLGAGPWPVLVYEILLSGFALFNHANIGLPAVIDRAMRTIIVTPNMHRIHHSVRQPETDSNFGNILSVWDRLFFSYVGKARESDRDMQIGLAEFRDPRSQTLWGGLIMPFHEAARFAAILIGPGKGPDKGDTASGGQEVATGAKVRAKVRAKAKAKAKAGAQSGGKSGAKAAGSTKARQPGNKAGNKAKAKQDGARMGKPASRT